MIDAIETVKKSGLKNKKPGGIHVIQPNKAELEARKDEGFKFIAYSLDFKMRRVKNKSARAASCLRPVVGHRA
jgi:2-dehydro-3-deoxyglucarate aldolase